MKEKIGPDFNSKTYGQGELQLLISFGLIDPIEWKNEAIKIIDNPDGFSQIETQNAKTFTEAYKKDVLYLCKNGYGDRQSAICVDQGGKRVDLRIR